MKKFSSIMLSLLLGCLVHVAHAAAADKLKQMEDQEAAISAQIKVEQQNKNYDKVKALREERKQLQKQLSEARKLVREEEKAAKAAEKRAAAEKAWEAYPPEKKLCSAIEYHRFDLVKKVMETETIDLTQPNNECIFPLGDAANRGDKAITEYLLQKKSPLTIRFGPAQTLISAMDLAASSKEDRTEILNLLKRYGAGQADSREQSVPGAITTQGDASSEAYLQNKFNYRSEHMGLGGTLTRALEKGHVNNIAWLLAHGADPEEASLGKSALFFAIESRDVAKVKMLVEAGADVNRAGLGFQSPLHYAEQKRESASAKRKPGYEEITAYLKQKGARYSARELGQAKTQP